MIGFISPFKILDYLDRLEIVKETGSEYHCKCPVCGDGGFKIDKPTGKYHAFKCGCEVKDIREAIRPWKEVLSEGERKKGAKDWNAYRQNEAAANCRNKWVLAVEGEKCVEVARERAIATITWQGSNWNKNAIASTIKALKKAGAEGLVYFPDNDEAGRKKASLVESAAIKANFPCLVLNPQDIWSEIPEKGDISDWIEAHPDLKLEELTSKLETAIEQQSKQTERQNHEVTEQQAEPLHSPHLPNWSQSDLSSWLASKYRSRLAWNTQLQQWYRYSSVTEGIWSIEPTEFVGQLVKLELEQTVVL